MVCEENDTKMFALEGVRIRKLGARVIFSNFRVIIRDSMESPDVNCGRCLISLMMGGFWFHAFMLLYHNQVSFPSD
jgi:hypothetical protein